MYCAKPFTKLIVGSRYLTCCPTWIESKATNDDDPWKIWNCESFQNLRKDVLERNSSCTYFCPAAHGKINMLEKPWHKCVMECGPKEIVFVTEKKTNIEREQERANRVLTAFGKDVWRLVFTAYGDPLESPVYCPVLQNLDGKKLPHAKITLLTHGLALPEYWGTLGKIHDNIDRISLNINGVLKDTYESFQGVGSWTRFQKVLATIKDLNKELSFNFVVCRRNMEEMIPFIQMAKDYDAEVKFSLVAKYDVNDFLVENVANPEHADHSRFMEILNEAKEHSRVSRLLRLCGKD